MYISFIDSGEARGPSIPWLGVSQWTIVDLFEFLEITCWLPGGGVQNYELTEFLFSSIGKQRDEQVTVSP